MNGFISWRMCKHLFFGFGINGRPIIDFQFSLLVPISKQGSGTAAAAADDDDEWIMFQVCTDAKS